MKSPKLGSRRPVIGIMTGSFHTDNSKEIVSAAAGRMRDENVDIRLYQGLDAKRYLNIESYVDEGFDYHYFSLFGYSKFEKPDILIVSFGTISGVTDPLPLDAFLKGLPDIPIVLLEDDTDIENGIHITIDNYGGMKAALEHLIDEHHCKDIVFCSGPRDVPDAQLRLAAFRNTMTEYGLPCGDDHIVWGDFTDQIDPLVEGAIAAHGMPDAFACANDDMAESVYRVLYRHGITPGEEVAVTGFDNIVSAQYFKPPLTTIHQDFSEVAKIAVTKAYNYFSDEDFTSEHLPAKLILRCSCGCNPSKSNQGLASDFIDTQMLRDERAQIKALQYENMTSSLMIRNLMDETITVKEFFYKLGRQLSLLHTNRSYICLLDEPKPLTEQDKMFVPDTLRLHMYQHGSEIISFHRKDAPVLAPGDIKAWHTQESGNIMATFLLFYGRYHYGIICVELPVDQMLFYYTLSLEIGSGLRYLFLALAQQESQKLLREQNMVLDYSASHDTLTGFYNRAGVMRATLSMLHQYRRGSKFIAVMGDLDHLKQINDTFGHDAGDDAICTVANILSHALPEGSPLGRTGGDEFTCLFFCPDNDDNQPDLFIQKVRRDCDVYNKTSGKPYYVNISIGCHVFHSTGQTDISAMLKKADTQLYEAKKVRRANVVREDV